MVVSAHVIRIVVTSRQEGKEREGEGGHGKRKEDSQPDEKRRRDKEAQARKA